MIGPEGAAQLVATYLAGALPPRIAALRARYSLLDDALPEPALVLPVDKLRLGVEDWPAVLVEVQQLRRLVRVDVVDGVELYAGTYPVRVYTWVRGDDQLDTDLARKRYALAVREALAARRQLAEATAVPSGIVVDLTTLRESYSPPLTDDAGATIAGAYLEVDVAVREDLEPTVPLGTAATVEPDTRSLPHPANL